MQTKHTPGPWSVIHNSWEVSTVYGHDDSVVAKCPIDSGVDELTQDHLESLMEANALLIAAAPDLLALAHQYRNDLLYPVAPDSRERRIAAIDAVLAKIGGAE